MKKLYSILLSTLIIIGCLGVGSAQNYIQIGSGTVSSSLPFYSSWNYSWSSLIYNQADLGGAKSITKIAFFSTNAKTMTNQKIYMKLTSDAVFATAVYENPVANGYTLVYDGPISSTANNWMEITLSAPFAYDGIKNLAIHAENRWGQSYGITFNATTSASNNNKSCGSDASFPTANGYLNPYPSALPNIKIFYASTDPATPTNEIPVSNSIKAKALPLALKVDLGANTTSYDLYFSKNKTLVTSMDASAKVVDAAVVAAAGTFTYNVPSILDSKTTYYWRVVAKNSGSSTIGPLWNFETQEVISVFPYNQDFESVRVPNPLVGDTLSNIIDTNYPDSTDWSFSPLSWSLSNQNKGHLSLYSARCSGSTLGDFWLKTPRINLLENHRVSFWYRISETSDYKSINPVYLQISTNGGTSWSNLDTLQPSSSMKSWEFVTVDLNGYMGDDVYLRWMYKVSSASSGVLFLDDITIKEIPNGSALTLDLTNHAYPDIYMNGRMPLDLILRNPGTANLVITGTNKVGPFTCDFTGTIKPGESDTAKVYFAPTAAGNFNGSVEFIAAGITEGNKITLSGKGLQVLNTLFESFDASTQMPSGWYTINSPVHQYSKVSIISGIYDANSQPNAAKILCFTEYNYPISLITPGVTNFGNNKLTFYAKKNDASYDLDIIIGVMDNPYNVDDFVEVDRVRLTSTFAKYEAVVPANNTKPYIAFRFGGYAQGETSLKSLRIDDISWDIQANVVPNPAIIASPVNSATNVDIMKKVELKWANGGANPEGYKVYLGTTSAANELVNGDLTSATNTFYKYTGTLEYSKTYYWKIVPYNQTGDAVNCPVWSFTTMTDPTISTFPYNENFDGVTNAPGFSYPLGWSIENHNNDGMCWDIIANNGGYINSFSAPNAMHVAFNYNPKDDYLYTPPMQLQTGKLYRISFKIHTMKDGVTGLIYNEKIKVFLGTSNLSTTMNTIVVDDNINQEVWKDVNGTFTVTQTGKYFLGFYAYSDPEQYLLIIDNVKVEEISEGAPSVDFNASKTTAIAGEIVKLTNRSISNPAASAYEWTITPADFTYENSTSATSENPEVKFRFAGTYSVSLKVTNSLGSNTKTLENYITINSAGLLAPQSLTATPSGSNVTLNWGAPLSTKLNEGFEGDVVGWSIKKSTSANGSDLVDAVIGTDDTWGIADKSVASDFTDYVHSGNRSMFINYTAGSGANPDYSWLITPDVQIASGDKLKYWIVYLNGPAGDGNTYYTLFNIKVNDGAGWVSIFDYNNQSPVNKMETEVSHDLSSYAGKTVKIAFVYQYNDGYQLSLDDIKVVAATTKGNNKSNATNLKPSRIQAKTLPIVNKQTTKGTSVSGYKVYRNHQLINTISGAQVNTYVDNSLVIGQYFYQVSALYTSPDGESDPVSTTVSVSTAVEPNVVDVDNISFFPNPSNGKFTLNVNSSEELVVTIFSIVGKEVYRSTVKESVIIDLGNIEKGVYIVNTKSKGSSISKRIVIR